jgi:TPP-dependent pyruvate/acetoin dehydrogenase alpha subunit
MVSEGWADRTALEEVHASILQEIDEAVAWAEQSPYPDASTLLDGVYETQ